MGDVKVELCSETGICSIIKADGCKVDLISPEVDAIRAAKGDTDAIKTLIGECDSTFAGSLDAGEIENILSKLSE